MVGLAGRGTVQGDLDMVVIVFRRGRPASRMRITRDKRNGNSDILYFLGFQNHCGR